MKFILPALLIVLFFISCSSGKSDSQVFYHGFTNNEWEVDQRVTFSYDITDTAVRYDVSGIMRVTDAFSFSTLDMSLALLTPSGSSRLKKIHLKMRNNSGEKIGLKVNDYYEIAFPVYDSIKFAESGKWVLNFNHNMPVDIYSGVVGIELFIEKQP